MYDVISENHGLATFLVIKMNQLLDNEELRDKLSFDQVRDEVAAGNIIQFLRDIFGDDIDLSLFNEKNESEFNKAMTEISLNLLDRESRKFGVQNNGLCLLVAYCVELIQETWK